MKPDRSKITTKALTVLLALALMTGAFTACSNGSGTGRNGGSGSGRIEAGDNGGSADGNGGTTGGATGGSTTGGLLPDDYVFDEECWHVQGWQHADHCETRDKRPMDRIR